MICKTCGKEFEPQYRLSKKRQRKAGYCSVHCSSTANVAIARQSKKDKGISKWTASDIAILKENYETRGYKIPELTVKFSKSAIHQRAMQFKLHCRKGIKVEIPTICPFHFLSWEKGYLAAFLDGEGSIVKKPKQITFAVSFCNTDRDALVFIQRKVKQNITPCFRKGRKPLYEVTVLRDAKVYWLLKSLYPYLIIKRSRAKDALLQLSQKYGLSHQLSL